LRKEGRGSVEEEEAAENHRRKTAGTVKEPAGFP
jgi:hypothetical protein